MKDIVVVNVNPMHKPIIEKYGLHVVTTRSDLNCLVCIIRSILLRLNPHFISLFNKSNWLQEIIDYKTVILFDSLDVLEISKDIVQHYPDKRLIVLYINPIRGKFESDLKKYSEVWTTDYEDSVNYDLLYCGQFVYEKYFDNLPHMTKYDVYFVGINKGRFCHVRKLEKKLIKEFGLKTYIRYVSPMKALFNKSYSGRIPYSKVLLETAYSKMILEYNQKGQSGLTLRCIEALVMRKKVITNNEKIKKYDFYNSSNFFVVKDDNLTGFKDFLNVDYCQYSEEFVSKYYFSNLLKRILLKQVQTDRV